MKIVKHSDEKKRYFANLEILDVFECLGMGENTDFIKISKGYMQNAIGLQTKQVFNFPGVDKVSFKEVTLIIED